MSPTKGQKRPMGSGGETSKAKDSRAASAQASKGTNRPPEMTLTNVSWTWSLKIGTIIWSPSKVKVNQFVRRRYLFFRNRKMKQPHCITMMISVGKFWTPKVSRKQEEIKLKSSKVFQFGKRFPGTRCPKEPEQLVRDGWMWTGKMKRIHSTEAA